jgi:transposase
MGQITVFSGPERRRRWSEEERVQILAEAFSPGACVTQWRVGMMFRRR